MLKLASTLFLLLLPLFATADTPLCLDQTSDTDGDGWGWEGGESCLIDIQQITGSVNQNCIDSDGDGWGWNGIASCRVGTRPAAQTVNPQTVNQSCTDSDGDGWGWNGIESCRVDTRPTTQPDSETCIDSDGDGWGWNGVESCVLQGSDADPTQTDNAIETNTPVYQNQYETATHADWETTISDEPTVWVDMPDQYTSLIVACDDTTYVNGRRITDPGRSLADPTYPGYYYDPVKAQGCAKISIQDYAASVPVYSPEPVLFSHIGIEVLYENGNEWNCTEETRSTLDEAFSTTDSASLRFDANGTAYVTIGANSFSGQWSLNRLWNGDLFSLEVFDRSDINTANNRLFRANPSYADGRLTLYRSGLSRLSCNRVSAPYPFNQYGEYADTYQDMWKTIIGNSTPASQLSSFSAPEFNLNLLRGDQLNGRTLQCAALYSEDYNNREFASQASTLPTQERIINIEYTGVDLRGNRETYDFGAFGEWVQNDQGQFWAGSRSELNIFRYSDELSLLYYSIGVQRITTQLWACRDIGGPSLCQDLDNDGFGWNGFGTCVP